MLVHYTKGALYACLVGAGGFEPPMGFRRPVKSRLPSTRLGTRPPTYYLWWSRRKESNLLNAAVSERCLPTWRLLVMITLLLIAVNTHGLLIIKIIWSPF